jgi:AraC-like DNA-binding protein
MDQIPFHQKEQFNPSFPFLARESRDMPTFSYPLHWHERLELMYIVKGRLCTQLDGKCWEANERDIIVVERGMIHGFVNPIPGTLARVYQFDPEIFGGDPLETLRMFKDPSVMLKPVINTGEDGTFHSKLEDCLMEMYQEYKNRDTGFQLAVKSKLYEFTTALLRKMASTGSPQTLRRYGGVNLRFERLISIIKRNYGNPDFTLERAAIEAGLSKFYFSRFFKEQAGENFHIWLARLRVRHARECLAEENKSITDIAYQCGFSSIATFNRVFRFYTGTSPSGFRDGNYHIS